MLKNTPALFVLTALVAAGLAAPAFAAEPGVDTAVAPGDDFFAFANGDWLAATEIPAGKERWNARTQIDVLARQQIDSLFVDASSAPSGSYARKVADFRAAYANDAAIETRGQAPLEPLLHRIDSIHDKTALTEALGGSLRADVDPLNSGIYDSSHLLGLSVAEGAHGEKTYVAYLVQGGLGLPALDDYLDASPDKQALRKNYSDYIERLLLLAGFDRAPQRAAAVLTLEIAIAQSHATPEVSGNDHNADNLWTRADFTRDAPGMDWSAFFAAAGLAKQQSFVVWQPSAIKGAAALVASQPLEAWKDYLRFHLIDSNADALPHAFADRSSAFHGAPDAKTAPRSERATEVTQQALSEILGRMYVEKYFPPKSKAKLQAILSNVLAAFRKRVEAVTWMTPASRKIALAKLSTLYVGLGYPEKWHDYSALTIDPADAFGNAQRIADWNYRDALSLLGKPCDMTEWRMSPQTVGAVLVFQQNSYNFPAALLQAPKFDPAASDATNYGAIGAILAHDVSHIVDSLGADYGPDGSTHRWWTAEDLAGYEAATAPLVKQYDNYRPFPDAAVNGKLTLVENLADLGGLNAAFDAYRHSLGARASDKDFVRQQDRQFFIGWARAWRGKTRDATVRKLLTTDTHAPETFRIATVRNLDAWYEAFDVKPGQRLYLPPEARLRIW